MSELHKALAVFGLEPGASREAITTRYKRLIMVWHPDRFPNEDGKKYAEEELKKINNANDVLKKHFETSHKASGCECQRPAGAAASGGTSNTNQQRQHGPGPGPGTKRKPDTDPEAEARRRDEERARKAAQDEAARKAAEEAARRQHQSTEDQFKAAQRQQNELKWNKIRWQIAAGEAALFIAICTFGWIGHDVKEWWHKVTWEWERDHPKQQDTPPPSTNTGGGYVPPYEVPPNTSTTPSTNTNPFGPVGPPPDNNPNMLPNGVMKPLDNSHVPVPNYPPKVEPNPDSNTMPPATNPPGFNWKPATTPDSSSLNNWKPLGERLKDNGFGDLRLNKSPLLTPNTSTTTSTTTDSGIDYDKYINH